MADRGDSSRPVALGSTAMVAAAHPLATLTGVEVLKQGGTAADAAVALNAVLGVTQPHCCGVGGDIFCLYYEAASRRVHFLNGAGRSGTRATLSELRQPDLAETLRLLAAEGPESFYQGRIAHAIASRLESDGFLLPGDLATHTADWGEPLRTSYRGYTVYETGLPTQGIAVLLALNLLEGLDLGRIALHSAEHLHALIEMVKLAYADRDRWVADPAGARLPVDGLLSKAYAVRRRGGFDLRKAQAYAAGDPAGDTTGFVVMDGRGDLVSVIQSLFHSFGSGVVPPGTGVVLHNRGSSFGTDPAHPNCLGPRKRPFHTLIAAVVTQDDRPVMGFATMGANGQAM